jgi:hypothetical protein
MKETIITLPQLSEGEIYVGAIISANGTKNYHIILLPGESDDVEWKGLDWQ